MTPSGRRAPCGHRLNPPRSAGSGTARLDHRRAVNLWLDAGQRRQWHDAEKGHELSTQDSAIRGSHWRTECRERLEPATDAKHLLDGRQAAGGDLAPLGSRTSPGGRRIGATCGCSPPSPVSASSSGRGGPPVSYSSDEGDSSQPSQPGRANLMGLLAGPGIPVLGTPVAVVDAPLPGVLAHFRGPPAGSSWPSFAGGGAAQAAGAGRRRPSSPARASSCKTVRLPCRTSTPGSRSRRRVFRGHCRRGRRARPSRLRRGRATACGSYRRFGRPGSRRATGGWPWHCGVGTVGH